MTSSSTDLSEPKKLLLRIQAANLPRIGILNALPDTYAVVTSVEGISNNYSSGALDCKADAVKTVEWGTTEVIYKHSHPQWTETFHFDYIGDEKKHIHVQVFREIKNADAVSLGTIVCELTEVYNTRNNQKVKRLPNGGVIFCRLEEVLEGSSNLVSLQLAAKSLTVGRKGFFKKASDTRIRISKRHSQVSSMSWTTVYRSNIVEKSADPVWEPAEVSLDSLCNGDFSRPLRIAVVINNALVAECETTLTDILNASQTQQPFQLQQSMTDAKEVGKIHILSAEIVDADDDDAGAYAPAPLPPPTLLGDTLILPPLPPPIPPPQKNAPTKIHVPTRMLPTFQSYDHRDLNVDWCWKETLVRMKLHPPNMMLGDPDDCWVKYDTSASNKLEVAFQTQCGVGACAPLPGYTVDFSEMMQTKLATKYQRDIQRVMRTSDVMAAEISFDESSHDDQNDDTTATWCWKETAVRVPMHPPSMVFGDPAECWVKYDATANDNLESAYQDQKGQCSPTNGYQVVFQTMKQTKVSTGYDRDVQRVEVGERIINRKNSANVETESVNECNGGATWCWKETSPRVKMHKQSMVLGDPADCWIKYDYTANTKLESAYQGQNNDCSPVNGYLVKFATMEQTKISTDYKRDVQRVSTM